MIYPRADFRVIKRAKEIMELNPIFLDTETTGTGLNDVVIEMGIVDLDGKILYDHLVNPGFSIPKESSLVNEITDEMVKNAPVWMTAWNEIEPIIKGRVIGLYNSDFDLRLIKQSHLSQKMKWDLNTDKFFCVMKLYSAFYGEWNARHNGFKYHKLENAGRLSGIELPNSHHAADDAKLTAALFRFVANYSQDLDKKE